MKRKPIVFLSLMAIALMMLSSCATTKLYNAWKDESYGGPIKRVLIIGVAKRPYIKKWFEDEFVRQFKAKGVDAFAAYRVLPSDKKLKKDKIRSKVKELNIDTVLVTRLVDRRTVKTHVPADVIVVPSGPYMGAHHYRNLHSYYGHGFDVITTPGYTIEEKFVMLESNIYDAKTEKIVWTVASETLLGDPSNRLIRSLVKILIKNLTELKMI